MSNFETELERWLALDQHFGQSDQGMAARLVRNLAVDRERLLRRIQELEDTLKVAKGVVCSTAFGRF